VVIDIVIPMTPPRALSPNARIHWAPKAKAAAKFRSAARLATFAAMSQAERSRVATATTIGYRIRVSWEPRRVGLRDEDNVLASCKAAIDGIADALGIDDRILRIRGIDIDRTSRLGVTVITLEEV
jgi:crossover junction endodeoxyribonuclease RusA